MLRIILLSLLVTVGLRAEEAGPAFVFASDNAGIIRFGVDMKKEWEYPAQIARDVWQLENGNVLFCYNNRYDSKRNDNPSGVMEVTADKKVVFHLQTTGQVFSCQRLADGRTLVGAASQGKLLLVGKDAKVEKEIVVKSAGGHSCMRNVRQVSPGRYIACEEAAHAVREYGEDGEMKREIKMDFPPYSAVRLGDGGTLICGKQNMVQMDQADRVTWSLKGDDLPEMGVRWFAGVQVLGEGRIFICNAGGKVSFFIINHQKKVVWQSNRDAGAFPMGHGVQVVGVKGPARK